ncbi:inner membrane protein YpjD [Vibrio sp. TH_r3]|uniref:cytochrome C assembly family protein n=1 Tax=Vibrio sp. TH_r3 TaxID=3082084 RepID=UPI0029531D9D|nr:inner membrane protein YpjD [Vibrio sp. TH_r3]MDV7104473.1 inner membrane protein YpjD [Vibrio sp. TH_r3]
MDSLIAIAAAVLYTLAVATIVPGLSQQSLIKTKTVFVSASLAIIFHGWLLHGLIHNGNDGQNLSMLNVASVVSFIIAWVMSMAMFKVRLWFLLPVVYGFSIISILSSSFLPGTFITHFEGKHGLLIHITIALFAYATLTIAALYAIQLAWLDYKLKNKKAMVVNPNFPPLMKVERQLFNIILIGNGLLTLTLLSGLVFLDDMFAKGSAHKSILSFIAWIIYSILLWGHYQKGWRGKRVTWFAIAGATLLTLAYFGSRFVREIILG